MRVLLLLIGFLLPSVAFAQGDPLGHSDRTASLYRDVLRLGADGDPLVPLSVLGHQDKVEISAAGGLRILGTGDGQVEFRVQTSVEVQPTDAKPAVLQHYVVLAQAPDWDFDVLRQKRTLWKERGLAIKTVASGATYSLKGRSFDSRQTLLCLDAIFADHAAAEATAQGLEQQFGEDLQTHATVGQPPNATLVAKSGSGEVRAADVLWFEAVGKGMLHVVGTRKGQRIERELPGRVYLVPSNDHGLEVVSEAALEQILEGVVASEIFHSAPEATLRAQAVAARTDMLAKVGTRHATDPFAICSEVHCQAYTGAGKSARGSLKPCRTRAGWSWSTRTGAWSTRIITRCPVVTRRTMSWFGRVGRKKRCAAWRISFPAARMRLRAARPTRQSRRSSTARTKAGLRRRA